VLLAILFQQFLSIIDETLSVQRVNLDFFRHRMLRYLLNDSSSDFFDLAQLYRIDNLDASEVSL
jgi:hypothetical protein